MGSGDFLTRFFLGFAGALVLATLAVGWATAGATRGEVLGASVQRGVEPRFSRIASELAGKGVDVRCRSIRDWQRLAPGLYGLADIGGRRIDLAPRACADLADLTYHHARPTDPARVFLLAAAVVTLSHEPQHSKGIVDEAVAECNAINAAHRTATLLGVEDAYARLLLRTYWAHYDDLPNGYTSPACRPATLGLQAP